MREILFKAKRLDNGEWVEGYYVFDKDDYVGIIVSYIDYQAVTTFAVGGVRILSETVCQYTGLKDKNGKKIFEGDRLKAKAYWAKADRAKSETIECLSGKMYSRVIEKGETVWTVEYANWNSFIGFRVYGVDRRWSAPLTYNKLYNGECEIIGNIHDKEKQC